MVDEKNTGYYFKTGGPGYPLVLKAPSISPPGALIRCIEVHIHTHAFRRRCGYSAAGPRATLGATHNTPFPFLLSLSHKCLPLLNCLPRVWLPIVKYGQPYGVVYIITTFRIVRRPWSLNPDHPRRPLTVRFVGALSSFPVTSIHATLFLTAPSSFQVFGELWRRVCRGVRRTRQVSEKSCVPKGGSDGLASERVGSSALHTLREPRHGGKLASNQAFTKYPSPLNHGGGDVRSKYPAIR